MFNTSSSEECLWMVQSCKSVWCETVLLLSRFTIYKVHKASKKKREKSSAKKERKATKTLAIVLGELWSRASGSPGILSVPSFLPLPPKLSRFGWRWIRGRMGYWRYLSITPVLHLTRVNDSYLQKAKSVEGRTNRVCRWVESSELGNSIIS